VFLVGSLTPWIWLRAVVQTSVPFAVAVGVMRHRLLDLQVVVRRTLLFAGLTAAVVVVFVGCTAVVSGFVDGGPLPVALGAALVAVGLTPVRDRLQRAVDRLVYGDRSDPVRAVASLGRHVAERDDATLAGQVLGAVTTAVKSPCAVLVDSGGLVRAQAGNAAGGEPLHLPLQVAARDIGALLVYPRTARDGWSRADLHLLDVLAQQVAVVAHVGHLNAELAQSRDDVLTATADERSRLRQELHDGLGPALSGIALGLEAAELALSRDPQRAKMLLQRLRQETQSAGREVRLLVEGLRPAALDGQGLADALATFTEGLSAVTQDRLALSLRMPRPLPALPPDVDAAAYRIVTEAVTNVVRHSRARSCSVEVEFDGTRLSVQVDDDGSGLPTQPRDGVGLSSMRRRAAELGGTWSVSDRPGGGTRIRVELPLRAAADRPPTTAPAGQVT
jgi:signal transduction histidine kinase